MAPLVQSAADRPLRILEVKISTRQQPPPPRALPEQCELHNAPQTDLFCHRLATYVYTLARVYVKRHFSLYRVTPPQRTCTPSTTATPTREGC